METSEIQRALIEEAAAEAGIPETCASGFTIKTLEMAEWAMDKLDSLDAQIAEVEDAANAKIERVQAWKERRTATLTSAGSFLRALLSFYLADRVEKGLPQTLKLTAGTVSARTAPAQVLYSGRLVVEAMKAAGLIERRPDLVRTEIKVDGAGLRKAALSGDPDLTNLPVAVEPPHMCYTVKTHTADTRAKSKVKREATASAEAKIAEQNGDDHE
jgi:hypothetical protein